MMFLGVLWIFWGRGSGGRLWEEFGGGRDSGGVFGEGIWGKGLREYNMMYLCG